MATVIASTYEILKEIGSGGGGIVYLGEHLRLHKKVVLKADKRTLSTKPEVLRREVDALKNLNHSYIPQVYDFIEEDGIVYTVMDYIEGESFNKPLKRGQRFSQAQVIEWACQLLEALVYLHSQPPHGILHADIKPANIMLTPRGDIRLIDFNIALALGEEGAIAVGRSFGYASPEHYGVDYTSANATQGVTNDAQTEVQSYVQTVWEENPQSSAASSTSSKRKIMLDIRSDIYSLGASLYHLLTGQRPAQNPKEIAPISPNDYSPAVTAIIQKAMSPNPDLRYQTAKEMLYAFEHLREEDPRTKRHKKRVQTTLALLTTLFLLGGLTTLVGLKQMEQLQKAYTLAQTSQHVLQQGDVPGALKWALQALPSKKSLLSLPYTPQAQKALTDALGIYDVSDSFHPHRTVELPSAPLCLRLSPSGKRAAVLYKDQLVLLDTDSGNLKATLAAEPSALAEVEFADEDTLLYAGDGAVVAYDIQNQTQLWQGQPGTAIAVCADGKMAATIYKDEQKALLYEVNSGMLRGTVNFGKKKQSVPPSDSFANPGDSLLALSADGRYLAVSFEDGSLQIFDWQNQANNLELLPSSPFTHMEGGFYQQYFAFCATDKEKSVFAVVDLEKKQQTGGFESPQKFGTQVDENGIYIQSENLLVRLDPQTGEQQEIAHTDADITTFVLGSSHALTATKNAYAFFDRHAHQLSKQNKEFGKDLLQLQGATAVIGSLDTPSLRILKLEQHPQADLFAYDPSYQHDEARINEEDATAMLFSYRGFRLYDIKGPLIAEVRLPDEEQVHDQQYRREPGHAYLEVLYKDGLTRTYSAKDGQLLEEKKGQAPDASLDEEFFTKKLRIRSPLHGTPTVYDKATGKILCQLEKDAYLTYVTEAGDYIVTQYITAEGQTYGLLLNQACETLAVLPRVCDVVGEKLIFDYPTGNLRQSRIYSIDELRMQGQNTALPK